MSTEYYTVPGIPYEMFVSSTTLRLKPAERVIYDSPHMVVDDVRGTFYVFKDKETGDVRFERFGQQGVTALKDVAFQYNCEIFNEYNELL